MTDRRETQANVKDQLIADAVALRSALLPVARRLRQSGNSRLTPTQYTVLGAVAREGPIQLGRLASRQQLSPAMITKVVAILEGEHLVERLNDDADRRVCLVRTTPAGLGWLVDNQLQENAWLSDQMTRLTNDEREALVAVVPVLRKLINGDG